ncbi:hypothetical protein CkaCkLH20_06943 [Colletotrichum karsti]|uniref:Large ribosomal subunit protein mL67 n=1 Tax=Colletotrichum karsti TaxID=1095194 RepID=A0A9P6I246_9PEZI|nr:uncharacterized protein CkaCkLH20_06943 [Colletotrichum karsti]KAF9875562.1 hypothetical protein CkaCkLH20_06943 [Colletotrichum karsti]
MSHVTSPKDSHAFSHSAREAGCPSRQSFGKFCEVKLRSEKSYRGRRQRPPDGGDDDDDEDDDDRRQPTAGAESDTAPEAIMFSVANFGITQLSVGGASRTSVRYASRAQPRRLEKARFPEGHGTQIWVWSHMMTKQVVYSNTEVLNPRRALRQIPFNGKKCKQTKLRKDYWEPLALIELPKHAGAAGQSVMQKLREFRAMHELCWGDEITFRPRATDMNPDDDKKQVRSRWERGRALNDQRANSIADMAAVLAGKGRGNRLLVAQRELDGVLEEGKELVGWKWFGRDNMDQKYRLLRNPPPKIPTSRKIVKVQAEDGTDQYFKKSALKAYEEAVAEAKDGEAPPEPPKPIKLGQDNRAHKLVEINPPRDQLLPVTVYWAVDIDRNYAESWSDNVTHGLLDNALRLSVQYEQGPVVDETAYNADNIKYDIKKPDEKEAQKLEA